MAGRVPHAVPDQENRWLPLTLAIIVHLALVAFFWIGISFNKPVPLAVEAEIWDMQYKDAAPVAQPEPEPVAEPEPEPEPVKEEPQPAPKPVVAPPPPKEVTPPAVNPDIALEQEKKKKEQARKEEQRKEELRKEEQRKEELRQEQEKKDLLKKQEEDKLAKKKEAEEKKKADELAKKKEADKKEAEEKKKADELAKKKAADDKKKAEADAKQKAADAKAADKRHQAELQRMMSQAGSGGSGTAEKSQGPRGASNYASKIAVKIRSNTVFDVPANSTGNTAVEYTVDLLPDGSVRNVRKTKSSGLPGFDEAVAKAIEKSQPFPPDQDGKVPNSFNIIHRPKDQ